MSQGAILQDNAGPHPQRVLYNDFLPPQQVTRLGSPARSPDPLNISRMCWVDECKPLTHPQPYDLNRIFQILQQEWRAIPLETLRRLAMSMKQCGFDRIHGNSDHTRF